MQNAFFIVGPTATGKSELAADVAERLQAEVVNVDAFQIYRGLPLLTAQPNESILKKAPHHLIARIPLTDEMSAAKFREMALSAIAEISNRGKHAIVVGGSGLYLKALTHGLAPLPAVDAKLRAELDALSLDQLYSRLAAVDPLSAEHVDRQNKRRLVRALEIYAQTAVPASAQREQWQVVSPLIEGVFVFRERDDLYERIDRRVAEMFRAGVVEEVAGVQQVSATAAKTLGLAAIRRLREKQTSEAECIAAMQQATRHYAKRQLTWFRRQTNFEPLNLSQFKDHAAAVDWILQKAERFFAPAK